MSMLFTKLFSVLYLCYEIMKQTVSRFLSINYYCIIILINASLKTRSPLKGFPNIAIIKELIQSLFNRKLTVNLVTKAIDLLTISAF